MTPPVGIIALRMQALYARVRQHDMSHAYHSRCALAVLPLQKRVVSPVFLPSPSGEGFFRVMR
jgi:hypothetical protein